MLQIISGEKAHRKLELPPSRITRPVSEKARGAIFDMISQRVMGAQVLDLFAGSGALGLEALSRGAKSADFVEKNNKVAAVLKRNIATLEFNSITRVITRDVNKFREDIHSTYDIVLMDPPYADFNLELVEHAASLLQYDGVIIVSTSSKEKFSLVSGLEFIQQKVYGDSMITVYIKK